jgi:hypothetical protein
MKQFRTHAYFKNMNKTSIHVAILTGRERHFWIHPDLLIACMKMPMWQQETGSQFAFSIVNGVTPVDAARNVAVKDMLKSGAEWLLQIDNDVVPPLNVLAVLSEVGNRKIVGLPCGMESSHGMPSLNIGTRRPEGHELHREIPSGLTEVDCVGSGCLLVHRDVFQTLAFPWFECSRKSELENAMYGGEDFGFCEKARTKGFSVWTHAGFPCSHHKTVDLSQYNQTMTSLCKRPLK